ncbi:signal transduction histidine kinase [Leadbetterella byssophila DSM 17132]|uniref:histidine kinase n=1 Tax=Leadbetterella byssophila (strain DSM 17132 / JCM 16389 / KACC 11308 / NBRC 106382 / 4M15) TaxID=649349 RepID=E4RZN6_LEAB4|nr:sensor histidine kinase [Leadbetterella byssophila]ADQ18279.1 signal transduction histidine kinase [Leadbetterella byssophila DSM 17132]
MKWTLFLFLTFPTFGQIIDQDLILLDSLILYQQFKTCDQVIDHLLPDANQNKQSELNFRKALLLERIDKNHEALEMLHSLENKAIQKGNFDLLCRIYIQMALGYEKLNQYSTAQKFLEKAEFWIEKYTYLKPKVLVRRAILFSQNPSTWDKALISAMEAVRLGITYRDSASIIDGQIVQGSIFYKKKEYEHSNQLYKEVLSLHKHFNNVMGKPVIYHNIARNYLGMDNLELAKKYSDSSFAGIQVVNDHYKELIFGQRAEWFYKMKNLDSAYAYQNAKYSAMVANLNKEELVKVRTMQQQFENVRNSSVIKIQKIFIGVAVVLILIVTFLSIKLLRKNRKISAQNALIAGQRDDLQALVEQKSVLLKELQHRVKNNLQHVISILEIQKEAVNFSNMEELVRENKNRIHSMSMLYSRLNSSEDIQFVRLEEYFLSLAHLVRDSYGSLAKKVKLDISCQMDKMEISKVLPLGMILVELISNSIKHAFSDKVEGKIYLHVWQEERSFNFLYMDNGKGYNFNEVREGALGMEIIKGLIQQLQGHVVTRNSNGFEIKIVFQ